MHVYSIHSNCLSALPFNYMMTTRQRNDYYYKLDMSGKGKQNIKERKQTVSGWKLCIHIDV